MDIARLPLMRTVRSICIPGAATRSTPPQGVKVIGRWHSVVGGRGVTVYEANDAQLIAQWAQQWSDVISFEIYAAIDDAGFAKVIG